MTFLLSLAALLPRLLLGLGVVHLVWNATDGRSLLLKLFLSTGVGFGVSSLLGFLWIWAGLPLTAYVVMESATGLIIFIWAFYAHTPRLQKLTDRTQLLWMVFLALGLLLFVFNLVFYALQYPHGRPDAWINWNVVARFIYLGGVDWQGTFLRQFDHPDYPLLMAVTHAITWVFVGETSVWGPIAFHFMISLSTAGLLFALISVFRDFKQASFATIIFLALPSVIDQGMRQYADLLFAYLFLAAGGISLLYFQQRETRFAVLAGFLVGITGWTKNEGFPAMIGFTLVWFLMAWRGDVPAFKKYLLGLVSPLLVILLFKIFLAPANDLMSAQGSMLSRVLDAERYKIILMEAGDMLLNLGGLPISLIGIMLLIAFLIGKTRHSMTGSWILGSVIIFQLTAYFGIFLLTPNDLTWHLNTSLDRLLLHVFPLGFLWFFIWLKSPQELH